jgi:NTE family protein
MSIFDFIRRRNLKVGLALSGGATHGAAHIGVLKVLEREGIKPSLVVGTSAGALVGAAYCAGIPVDQISAVFKGMNWPNLLKPNLIKPLSIFDTTPMENFLRANVGDCKFEDLKIPFAVIVCDIMTGERIVINKGPLATAARASASIPGLFSPVEWNEHLLVDGGVVDNFPVEHLRPMGANYTIGVDLSTSRASGRRPSNTMEVFMDMINIMQSRGEVADSSLCDCYIHPDTRPFSKWSFGEAEKIEKAGIVAAEAALPQLKKDLHLK